MPKIPEIPVQTRLPPAAHRQVVAIAKSRGTSVYKVCRDLVVAQLGVRQGDPYAAMLDERLDAIEQRLTAAEAALPGELQRRIARLEKETD